MRYQPSVQNKSNIIRLSSKNLLLLTLQKAIILNIKGNLTLALIPIALSNSSIELLGRLHTRRTSSPSASGNENDGALDILDIKLKLILLVGRVERSSDSALPRGGEE